MRRFEGVAVMVCGSTGLAGSAARALAAEGASVFIASRTLDHARSLANALLADGGRAAWHAGDLSQEADAEAAVRACVDELGRIDAVYHVAGISARRLGDGPIHEATLEGWHAVLEANATSWFLVARAAVRTMLAQDPEPDGSRGVLLAMSSVLARHPSPDHFGTSAYAASKGAIESLVRAIAARYARDGIRVNAIAPALVATPMSQRAQADPEILDYLATRQPLAGGPMQTDDVTPVALHLLSQDSRMITGQVLDVDAGWGLSEPPR